MWPIEPDDFISSVRPVDPPASGEAWCFLVMRGQIGCVSEHGVPRPVTAGELRWPADADVNFALQEVIRVLGTRPIRPDGIEKVTGKALYGADMQLPRMLFARKAEAAWVNVAVEVSALFGVIWFRYTATKDLRRGTQLRKD